MVKCADIVSVHSKTLIRNNEEDVQFVIEQLGKLSLELKQHDEMHYDKNFTAERNDVEGSFNLEDDGTIQEAIVEDAARELDNLDIVTMNGVELVNRHNDTVGEIISMIPPSLTR